MWFLGKRARREKILTEFTNGRSRMLPPEDGETPTSYVSIPEKDIPFLAAEYVTAMETQRTNDWCRCEWLVHPEDEGLPKGKRRLRRGHTAPDCPIHTKEGFLMYFFEWVFDRD